MLKHKADCLTANKSDTVRRLIHIGEYKKALNIAKGFWRGLTKEDSSKMVLAYECMVHTGFYEQLGTDTVWAISEGVRILMALYGQGEDYG